MKALPCKSLAARVASTVIFTSLAGNLYAEVFDLEEVVVTAQKREQALTDVGIAVTAITGEQMKQLGYNDSTEIIAQTPNVMLATPNGGSSNIFSIRGVAQNDFADHQESPNAVYIDEAYISQTAAASFLMFDLNRVEVLRGPQGTLFGRNATGGLVHYISNRPTREFEAYVDLTVGDYDQFKVETAVSGPLSDKVSARLSVATNRHDALIENNYQGGTGCSLIDPDKVCSPGKDSIDGDDKAFRFQLQFDPTDTLGILLNVHGAKQDIDSGIYNHQASTPTGPFGTGEPAATDLFGYADTSNDNHEGSWNFNGFNELETQGITATIDWQLGGMTLTSITDVTSLEKDYQEDSDASPVDFFNFYLQSDVDQFSQEFRLNGDAGSMRWVTGLYYLNIDGDYTIGGDVADATANLNNDYTQETRSWAVFGQVEYDLTDSLTLIGGLRLTHDDKEFDFHSTFRDEFNLFGAGVIPDDIPTFDYVADRDAEEWSGKLELDYRPAEDTLLYFSINRGIKAGGFSGPLDPSGLDANADGVFSESESAAMEFDEEVLTAYEIGIKTALTDKIQLNAAAFYYDYENYQAYNLIGLTQVVFNTDAEISGGELEIIANPARGLEIVLGASVLDATALDVPLVGGQDTDIVQSPDYSINGLVRYEWPALNGTLAVQTDFSYLDDHTFNINEAAVLQEDAYGLVNARVSYLSGDETWSIAAFVKNLTDKQYRVYGFDVSGDFGMTEEIVGDPMWWGMTFSYRWR